MTEEVKTPPALQPTVAGVETLSEEEMATRLGLPTMSKDELKRAALENGGYSLPGLNDTLYLHFKGYRRIENLEEYTGLKSLWLHSNGLGKIEGLDGLRSLRCLFLQRNAFTKIEGMDSLTSLVQLDLSENSLQRVEGLSALPCLATLNLATNVLTDAESICHLKECQSLTAVDLSNNQLSGQEVVDCLAGMATVSSLCMTGNPVVSKVASFRRKMIVACSALRYLDRPIFENERAAAEAWATGGPEAERETKERLRQAKKDSERNAMLDFRAWQKTVRHDGAPRYEVDQTAPVVVPPSSIPNVPFEDGAILEEERPFIEILEEEDEPPPIMGGVATPVVSGPKGDAKLVVEQVPAIAEDTKAVPFQDTKKVSFQETETTVEAKTDASTEPALVFQEPKEATLKEPTPADTEKENEPPLSNAPAFDVLSEDVEKSKRIRDSLAIMKERNNANQLSGDPSWTADIEERLLALASEQHHDFGLVAAKMAEEYGEHFTFDADSCSRRWALLDLANSDKNALLLASPSEEESPFASTEKSLAYFSNAEGVRKTMNELCFRDEDSDPSTPIPGVDADQLPGMDDQSEESDTVMHRGAWESLEAFS
ncbi:hypothetical protein ACHAXT_001957 [Thalassiosira profunda]